VVITHGTRNGHVHAARSGDGGRTWQVLALPRGTKDVQLVSRTVAYALTGRTLYRSTDAGGHFARVAIAPSLGSAGPIGASPPTAMEFSSSKRGVLLTPTGPFVTGNGGRTLEFLAVPGAITPPLATVSGSAVAAQDPLSGAFYRQKTLLNTTPPKLTLAVAKAIRHARGGGRTLTVAGHLPGVGAGEPVAILGLDRSGPGSSLKRVVRTDARGRFRASVRVARSERGVQARYRGIVRADRTLRGATSPVVKVEG
jgi:hypothetical protein